MTGSIAALYDVHANLPALDAVLADVERAGPDLIVFGGDLAAGPMARETIERSLALGDRARFVRGNGDREIVTAFDTPTAAVADDAPPAERVARWVADLLSRAQRDFLAGFEVTVSADVDGAGPVLFCHGSPRSDDEIVTRETPEPALERMLDGVAEPLVVCGHTHVQFDRRAAGRRVVNAGSVGMPYQGDAAAFWLLLGPAVELRRTEYDVDAAVEAIRATGYPLADEMVKESLLEPVDADWVSDFFEKMAEQRGER